MTAPKTMVDRAREEAEAHAQSAPEGAVIYRAVRQAGEDTPCRPSRELAWSGLAAGLSMGLSLVAEGLLRTHLPDAPWTPLVAKWGYAAGFLIVILGRQELFTEQTLSAVLPLLSRDREEGTWSNVARAWTVILAANLIGSLAFAAFTAWSGAFPADAHEAFSRLGHEAMAAGMWATGMRGIAAGFVIASMIWLLPAAGSSRMWVIVLLAYLVGIGGFAHVIAGSTECLYVVLRGERPLGDYLLGFLVPALAGNSIGGVSLVALLAHAQHAPIESK